MKPIVNSSATWAPRPVAATTWECASRMASEVPVTMAAASG